MSRLLLWESENMSLHTAKVRLFVWLWLRILKYRGGLRLCRWVQVHRMSPWKWKIFPSWSQRDAYLRKTGQREKQHFWFEGGERGLRAQECRQPLEVGKAKGKGSVREHPDKITVLLLAPGFQPSETCVGLLMNRIIG